MRAVAGNADLENDFETFRTQFLSRPRDKDQVLREVSEHGSEETEIRGNVREIREGQTLVRALNFETAEEEYDYEMGRNQSHFMLLQFAYGDKKPVGTVVARINELRVIAEKFRSRAEMKAAEGAHAEAIELLNESTNRLLGAIRMSGVFVPG